jgi:hypothetical protein
VGAVTATCVLLSGAADAAPVLGYREEFCVCFSLVLTLVCHRSFVSRGSDAGTLTVQWFPVLTGPYEFRVSVFGLPLAPVSMLVTGTCRNRENKGIQLSWGSDSFVVANPTAV